MHKKKKPRFIYVSGNAGTVGWVKSWTWVYNDHTHITGLDLTLSGLAAFPFQDMNDLRNVLTYIARHDSEYGCCPIVVTRDPSEERGV